MTGGGAEAGWAARFGRGTTALLRGALGLLVGDGAVAIGVLLAVAAAAVLAAVAGPSELVGWVLLGLVWVALATSLARARSR